MAYAAASSNTITAPYDGTYLSLYDTALNFEPEVMRKLYQKFGKGFGIIDMIRLMKGEVSLTRNTVSSRSQGALERPVIIGEAIESGAEIVAGAISVKLSSDSYDANNDCVVRPGDTIFIPGKYFDLSYDVQFQCLTVGASSSIASTFDSFALGSGLTLGTTIPSGTAFQVGPTVHARGTDQPSAKSRGQYSQEFTTAISKETTDFDGGIQAQQLYTVGKTSGGTGLWGMALADAEFNLDSKVSAELWSGQLNSNELAETNSRSSSATLTGTLGMWGWAAANASDHAYIDTFTVKDLDAIDDLFKATGVVCTSAGFMVGHKLFKQVQDAAHDYISQYSGGSDLISEDMKKVGFTPTTWNRTGIDYRLVNLAQLSNNQTFGANAKNFWTYAGLVIPDEQVTISDTQGIYNSLGTGKGKMTLNNVSIGYLDNQGENRKRIVQSTAGINGMGYQATNSYDVVQMNFLTEYALIANEVEKWVRVMKSGTY